MKKLFISQPMKDKTNEQILAEREKAIRVAKERVADDVEVIDSFFKDAPHDAKHGLELLTYNDEECFFIDTKGNHLIIVRNPMQLYKYNISSHTTDAPIGIAKHTATGGKSVTFRNFVL